MKSEELSSWGRYPPYLQIPHTCYWRSDLTEQISTLAHDYGSTLPYGSGRSYGDSCMAISDNVLQMRKLDRFISADWQTGAIVAEAGVTLEEVLALSIPNGWFLPVTPGTKYVTLGGAVANDVHGKNHHVRGTFGCHVLRFGLARSDQAPIICSRDVNQNYFSATIGGLGMTGAIEWVEMQLMPIRSSKMEVSTIRFDTIAEFFSLSEELDGSNEYAVAWVDCLATGSSLGRGVYMVGNHSPSGELAVSRRGKISVPFTPPISAINKLSLRFLNSFYYRLHKPGRNRAVVDYEPFFYPLDRILKWNRVYGPKGFQQFQCVIPDRTAANAIPELLDAIATCKAGSFLAVLKRCGDRRSPGLLSFPMPGVSLALDFPHCESLITKLFPRFDAIVRHAGGRLYPAKDAHMSGEDFRDFYPNWRQVQSLRDPAMCSRFWSRVSST